MPECDVIMMGCKAWSACEVTADRMAIAPPSGPCPVCGSGVLPGHDSRYCARCDRVSPAKQRRIDNALRVERIGVDSKTRAEVAEGKAKVRLRSLENSRLPISESHRRWMWNGYRGSILRELVDDVPNATRLGRDWLRSQGLEPDWSLVLDRRGNIIGKSDPDITP